MCVSVCVCPDYSVFNQEPADEEADDTSTDSVDQKLLIFQDGKPGTVSGHALWRQQFSSVAWLHMLNMRRERKAFVYTSASLPAQLGSTQIQSSLSCVQKKPAPVLPHPLSFCRLTMFLSFVATLLLLSLVTGNLQINAPSRQFLPIYLLKRNEAPHRYATSLLVQNSSGQPASQEL